MIVTLEMLIFLLETASFIDQKYQNIQCVWKKSDSPPYDIQRIQIWDHKVTHQINTLYLVSEELVSSFLQNRNLDPLCFILITDKLSQKPPLLSNLRAKDHAAIFLLPKSSFTIHEIGYALVDILQMLLQWEVTLSNELLQNGPSKKYFQQSFSFLHQDSAIIDQDLNVLWCTEGYTSRISITNGQIPSVFFQDEITREICHQTANRKDTFYYYLASLDLYSLCFNIISGDQHIAYIQMLLDPTEQKLPKGAEELFEIFCSHIQALFSYGKLMPLRNSGDQLHTLCRALLASDLTPIFPMDEILKKYGWERNHSYTAIIMQFTSETGWATQLSTTLPHLATLSEQEWTNSCAVTIENDIMLVINRTLEQIGSESQAFLQQVAYFVRENLCKAGISPSFSDFSLLKYARQAANAALILGSAKSPHLWHYLFEDFQLPYMIGQIVQELPLSMLCHPAVRKLMEYDEAHNSSMTNTLRTYLTSNLNMTAAADQLYIHRTSFCRRMDHIRQLTGLNFDSPDTILSLLLTFHLQRV